MFSIADAIYYTFILSGFAYLITLIVSVHKPIWLLYCLQAFLLGLYFAALDGDLQRWMNLGYEAGNLLIWVTGVTLLVAGFLIQAHVISPTHELVRWKTPLRILALASLLLLPLHAFFPLTVLHPLIITLATLGLVAMVVPPFSWSFLPLVAKKYAMPTIIAVSLFILVGMATVTYVYQPDPQLAQVFRRLFMVWAIISGVITMAYMTRLIERTRRRNADRMLRAARKETDLMQALYQAEASSAQATQLARQRALQLRKAGHDIRQPLFALRTTLDLVDDAQSRGITTQMREALAYADRLAARYLDATQEELSETLHNGTYNPHHNDRRERQPASYYFNLLARMYGSQAKQHGVSLVVGKSSALIDAEPVRLTRIMSNLIANALQHSRCSRILIGARRTPYGVRLEVHDDGMGYNSRARDQNSHNDGSALTNRGLGLGIVADLCDQADWDWQVRAEEGRGTVMSIHIPQGS